MHDAVTSVGAEDGCEGILNGQAQKMYVFFHAALGWRCTSQILTHVIGLSVSCSLVLAASRNSSGHYEGTI